MRSFAQGIVEISIYVFHFKLYSELLFFTAKNCNSKIRLIVKLDLILDCNKIRLNVPLDRSITVIYHI